MHLQPLLGIALSLGLLACSERSSSAEKHPFQDEMERLAGSGARSCGFVKWGGERQPALDCAHAADTKGERYWVAIQHQGVDSDVWSGAVLMLDGTRNIVEYDSNPWGQPELMPQFRRQRCRKLAFDLTLPRVIECHLKPERDGDRDL